ncbi:MAG TPA: carbonic anhydrase [Flavobacteriales bacterium]|nr:carbonic anhydrase [Flavobacteriales bacterium]
MAEQKKSFFDSVFENNQKWVAGKKAVDPGYFERLAQGQNPEVLFVGCSDSRVTAEDLMGAQPGEVFVHRNISNMVGSTDLNALSVVEYAIGALQVGHVVVCGHYGCGGVKAAMQAQDLGLLNPWLRRIRDVYRLHRAELDAITDEQRRYDRLVELNVEEQCINVIKTAVFQKAYLQTGKPEVHAWVFDMRTGNLVDLNFDFPRRLEEIREIYDLRPLA